MKNRIHATMGALTVAGLTLLGLGLSFNAGASAGQAGGLDVCVSMNGDVNADGKLDLSDPVTILGHLFLGKPTQLPPICNPQGFTAVPDTGQTECYGVEVVDDDEQWVPVTCDSAFGRAQDAGSATGCPSNGRFLDNRDSTVTDTCTGLMWQKDTADSHADGQPNEQDYVFWSLALDYCDNLSFAGYTDWRLPNVRELESLVDYGRSQPSIDPTFTALNAPYWTSTTYAGNPAAAWIVDARTGQATAVPKDQAHFVRAVRTAH